MWYSATGMKVVVWLVVGAMTVVAMEFWAAFLHGRMWHGVLWPVHRSHHTPRAGRWELNDALSVLHAPIAIALILYGCQAAPSWFREVLFAVGVGMTLFGLAYVVVHDGLVHRRLPVRGLLRVPYFVRLYKAHRYHHTRPGGGGPYGLFLGHRELALESRSSRLVG
jgi:beta-carotene 3-hydroxylase